MDPSPLRPDPAYAHPVPEDRLQRAAEALRGNGFTVHVVDSPEEARLLVVGLVPPDRSVFTATSETLRLSGIAEEIDHSGRFDSVRKRQEGMDPKAQRDELRRMGAAPDYVLGSVHAVTEAGQLVIASATGSQLAPYAAGAARAIWVVGAQKVVPDLDAAFRRIEAYAYPLEDQRARVAYGVGSAIRKILVINGDLPRRSTVVLIRDAIGY